MHQITLINTRHDNIGECNSNALFQILNEINPEIIFIEFPPSQFHKYHEEEGKKKLEAVATSNYLEAHNAKNIPVDSDALPSRDFFADYEIFTQHIIDLNLFNFKDILARKKLNAATYGFRYLNSDESVYHNEEKVTALRRSLVTINDPRLTNFYTIWDELTEHRENEMLDNIHNYSLQNSYDKAVFLVGAAHRKSIIDKIKHYQKDGMAQLNWKFW